MVCLSAQEPRNGVEAMAFDSTVSSHGSCVRRSILTRNGLAMAARLTVAAACLLAGCEVDREPPPMTVAPLPSPGGSTLPLPGDGGLTTLPLPARPAGAAFAAAGEEHVLLRRPPPEPDGTDRSVPHGTGTASLPERVTLVHAAWRRRCAGTALNGDRALLAGLGGQQLAELMACAADPSVARPRPLFPWLEQPAP